MMMKCIDLITILKKEEHIASSCLPTISCSARLNQNVRKTSLPNEMKLKMRNITKTPKKC